MSLTKRLFLAICCCCCPLKICYVTCCPTPALQDWKLLYHEGGLRTFMAVPVTGQDGLLGVVGLASKRHGAFMEYWCALLP